MSEHEQPEDFQHLPTADGGADQAQRAKAAAKAALWKQVAERRQQTLASQAPADEAIFAPLEETAPAAPMHDDWADLLSLDPDAPHVPMPPMEMPAPPPVIATPVEVETRHDISSYKRGVIVHNAPPAEGSQTFTRVIMIAPKAKPPQEPEISDEPPMPQAAAETLPETPAGEKQPDDEPRDDKSADREAPDKSESKSDPEKPTPGAPTGPAKPSLIREKWESWGGKSLSISVCIHLLILGIGGAVVVNQGLMDKQIDFLPGGTKQGAAASQELEHKIQQKKSPWLKQQPLKKIVSMSSISDVVLPDEVPDLLELPKANSLMSSGSMGGAMGLGGAGGGFGKGMGLGGKGGMVFQPLSMFGREIKAKRLALVLDVSTSMAPYLPRVIEEVDKVARDSMVILYFGCGLDKPPPGGVNGDEIYRTSGPEFEKFWRMGGGSIAEARRFKFKPSDVIPSESIYRVLSRRPQTYFIHAAGLGYTWVALLHDQVRQADALYWFSDFQDSVDFSQVLVVKDNILRRKQKLYIQPFTRGSSFDLIKSQLVEPSGGDVIEAVFE